MSTVTEDRNLKRRAVVSRLKKQGKPAGYPKMGTRHIGPRGRRRIVLDEIHHEVVDRIVFLRDEKGLAWNAIALEAEALAAKLENREPRRRWEMTSGWTKQKCIIAYRKRKAGEDRPPEATHRRCRFCEDVLPVDRFAEDVETCRTCQITGPVRTMEASRRRLLEQALLALGRAVEQADSSDLQAIADELFQAGGGPSLAAIDIDLLVREVSRNEPGTRRVLSLLKAIPAIEAAARRTAPDESTVAALTDAELDRELRSALHREYGPIINAFEELVNSIKEGKTTDDL